MQLQLDINKSQALALAQFVKRVGWVEVAQNSVDKDEAYEMIDALNLLAKALAQNGFSPR